VDRCPEAGPLGVWGEGEEPDDAEHIMNPAVGAKEDVPDFLLCLLTPIDVAARKRLLLIHRGRCSPTRRFSAAVLDELLTDSLHASPAMQGPRPR
jgi:hypothetical protein